ncbi:uncharacterized protein LOC110009404 [Jatropha curcas]|uniref:uncharacterized protein LOC110009404 n=1 Tax=Jatropha curcas TaxID=180498 RepID=UPI001893F977|nr:uncharacterized protein LOC110009404 [Jatropha curcas]
MEQERKSGNERTKPETNVTVNENKVSVTANENMASVTASVEIVAANANIAGVSINVEKDSLKEENGCLIDNEQSKPSETVQKSGANDNAFPNPPEQLLLLDGRLRDLPTFLTTCRRRQSKGTDDMPGSKIPTSILRIGSWEYISTNENGLAAIFWFGEQMLVWEVIAGGKKNHILIQWCDIVALKASCPDNEPGTLTIVLARQPTFISTKYPKPQHRECNIWEVTPDCTHGQASIHRTHFLQFPQGILKAQFEKLIQCDMRLRLLSQQPEIVLDSPYFEHHSSVSEDQDEAKGQDIDQVISDFQDLASPSAGHSPTLEIGKGDIAGETSEHMSQEAPPSSGSAISILAIGLLVK